jgi:dihydrofolate reductase
MVVRGANLGRQLLRAGIVDELRVDIMPVVLGSGLRFFPNTGLEHRQLETIDVQTVGSRTSLRFRVKIH